MINSSVENNLRNAEKFVKQNDIENASKIYKDILVKFPKNLRAINSLKKLKRNNFEKKLNELEHFLNNGQLELVEEKGKELFHQNGNSIKLLRILGTTKAELRKLKEAEDIFIKLLEIEPSPYMTLANLGSLHFLEKNYEKSTIYFKKSLDENPKNENALIGMGLLFMKKKEYDFAIQKFSSVVENYPQSYSAYLNIGNCYKELEKYELALEYYKKALEIKSFPEVYNNIGTILSEKGLSIEAIEYFSKSIQLNETYYEAINNRGLEYFKLKKIEKAIEDFEKSIHINPNYESPYIQMGYIFQFEKKEYEKAIQYYLKGLHINPNQYLSFNNLGVCFTKLHKFDEAIKYFDKAINFKLDYAAAYNNKGYALFCLHSFEEALKFFEIALSLDPKNPEIPLNIGNLMSVVSRYAEAVKYFEKAISLKPDYADAFFNLSLIKLQFCDFKNGLRLYEYRLSQNKKEKMFTSEISKRWDGLSSLDNKKVVVLSEQGLGDTIQFCRFVKLLPLKDSNIILKVQDCLVEIISTLDKHIKVVGNSAKIENYDFQIPLLSLPFHFNINFKTIPFENNYLFAKTDLIKKWKKKIGTNGIKIGIAWKGSNSEVDRYRSFPIKEFEILSSIKNVRLISLQKNDGIEQLNQDLIIKVEDHSCEIDTGDQAFLDTAAIINNLDLVITCCTSIAHLSGSLNCPTWVLLAASHDWRWFIDNKDSVWYPSVSLFRQENLNDWKPPFLSIKQKLIEEFKN